MRQINVNELYKRTRDFVPPDLAQVERWVHIGAGSLGGIDAEFGARLGIGCQIIIDRPDERLEEHNIARHILDYDSLGRLKIEAIPEHLRPINPAGDIRGIGLDVLREPHVLTQILEDFKPTQIHVTTDNEASKHVANISAIKAGVPLIAGAVFDGGVGGETFICRPGQACYGCMASHLRISAMPTGRAPTRDYTDPDHLIFPAFPALYLDIVQIGLNLARVALMLMLAKRDPANDLPGNYLLFGNRKVDGLFPGMLHSEILDIPKDSDCKICGGREPDAQLDAVVDAMISSATAADD